MSLRDAVAALALTAVCAGCVTRAEIVQRDSQMRSLMQEQRKQLQAVQREVERLRGDVEQGGPRGSSSGGGPSEDRLTALEQRMDRLELGAGSPPPGAPAIEEPQAPVATRPSPPAGTPPPPPPVEDDAWTRDVGHEQAAAAGVNAPERAEYSALLDGVSRKDCAKTVPQLNSFASNHKESPLADNALYWAARCYALRGDQNQAITKFYDVVTRYPKGDKAPAALWAQGNIFVAMGDSPDARLAFSKLIRDYPSSEEAGRARQKLSELED